MAEGSFNEIFRTKSKEEFAKNPVSLTGYLIEGRFPKEDIVAYRTMARMCPAVVAKLLRGGITAEEAANMAAKQAKVDASTARSLFDRMCGEVVVEKEPEPPAPKPDPVPPKPVFHSRFTPKRRTTVNGISFELSDKEARLVKFDRTRPWAKIPDEVEGLPVTRIGSNAFERCDSAPFSLDLPKHLTMIEDDAFDKCTSLQNITIPESTSHIGENAFRKCAKLRSVEIPESVTVIRAGTFSFCSSLQEVKMPGFIVSIGDRAFMSCRELESLDIPASTTSIGVEAFRGCDRLQTIELPDSLTEISKGCFNGCKRMFEIEIPENVKAIGERAFWECESLEEIVVPNSVRSIGEGAFCGCSSLECITLPDGLAEIPA